MHFGGPKWADSKDEEAELWHSWKIPTSWHISEICQNQLAVGGFSCGFWSSEKPLLVRPPFFELAQPCHRPIDRTQLVALVLAFGTTSLVLSSHLQNSSSVAPTTS